VRNQPAQFGSEVYEVDCFGGFCAIGLSLPKAKNVAENVELRTFAMTIADLQDVGQEHDKIGLSATSDQDRATKDFRLLAKCNERNNKKAEDSPPPFYSVANVWRQEVTAVARRRIAAPTRPKPAISIIQLCGSGTTLKLRSSKAKSLPPAMVLPLTIRSASVVF